MRTTAVHTKHDKLARLCASHSTHRQYQQQQQYPSTRKLEQANNMPSGNHSARLRKATERFDKNVTRRIATNSSARTKKQDEGFGVGPALLIFLAFVIIGSSLLEIFRPN